MAVTKQPWPPSVASTNIREIAADLQCDLAITLHAKQRMLERAIIMSDILCILRQGYVYEEAENSTVTGLFKYKMEGQSPNSGGRVIRVVVIPDQGSCQLKVVTIMWRDEK